LASSGGSGTRSLRRDLRWNAAIAAPNQAPHASSAAEVADALGVDTATGLSDAEAERRCAAYGPNRLPEPEPLRNGIGMYTDSIEERMGVTIGGMVGHYERSVLMIEDTDPDSVFRSALREELDLLGPLRGG